MTGAGAGEGAAVRFRYNGGQDEGERARAAVGMRYSGSQDVREDRGRGRGRGSSREVLISMFTPTCPLTSILTRKGELLGRPWPCICTMFLHLLPTVFLPP